MSTTVPAVPAGPSSAAPAAPTVPAPGTPPSHSSSQQQEGFHLGNCVRAHFLGRAKPAPPSALRWCGRGGHVVALPASISRLRALPGQYAAARRPPYEQRVLATVRAGLLLDVQQAPPAGLLLDVQGAGPSNGAAAKRVASRGCARMLYFADLKHCCQAGHGCRRKAWACPAPQAA